MGPGSRIGHGRVGPVDDPGQSAVALEDVLRPEVGVRQHKRAAWTGPGVAHRPEQRLGAGEVRRPLVGLSRVDPRAPSDGSEVDSVQLAEDRTEADRGALGGTRPRRDRPGSSG